MHVDAIPSTCFIYLLLHCWSQHNSLHAYQRWVLLTYRSRSRDREDRRRERSRSRSRDRRVRYAVCLACFSRPFRLNSSSKGAVVLEEVVSTCNDHPQQCRQKQQCIQAHLGSVHGSIHRHSPMFHAYQNDRGILLSHLPAHKPFTHMHLFCCCAGPAAETGKGIGTDQTGANGIAIETVVTIGSASATEAAIGAQTEQQQQQTGMVAAAAGAETGPGVRTLTDRAVATLHPLG